MELLLLYVISGIALLIGTAAIYMTLIEGVSIRWIYYHYFIRKPINWLFMISILGWTTYTYIQTGIFPISYTIPTLISVLALVLSYKMHQEHAFPAVFFPDITNNIDRLPLKDDMEMAVIEYNGITKSYPLDYVIHHHIINDHFHSKTVALTYCAMCRSIIPFDVTEIGPLFVGSFKNANMIVADKRTKTFFQQATFQSVIGPLHPYELTMIPFQILSWKEVKQTISAPTVVSITEKDCKSFELPVPGLWKKISNSETTPGLSGKNRDKTFPSRTRVIGIIDATPPYSIVYLKKEILAAKVVVNKEHGIILIGTGKTVTAFRNTIGTTPITLEFSMDTLYDSKNNTRWDRRGKYLSGEIIRDLEIIAISDEYWFSWIKFHKQSSLIRL
ncbi:DUF3179 domain-containing (seleno)protein [Aquimarina hainanensis]|uniref:DUF3179 domain-containing (Seleno)protein n=1 Tax=Aquimarina hainanensis TaxID=1578017 RepID=A0ABW5NCH6_9FLAO